MPLPESLSHGIQNNLAQFSQQLLQVFLVGLTLGLMRTVVPALAETEFGVAQGSFLMLTSFVIAFGIVKGVLNFVAGRLAEKIGRQRVLVLGWVAAIPVPMIIFWAPSYRLYCHCTRAPAGFMVAGHNIDLYCVIIGCVRGAGNASLGPSRKHPTSTKPKRHRSFIRKTC